MNGRFGNRSLGVLAVGVVGLASWVALGQGAPSTPLKIGFFDSTRLVSETTLGKEMSGKINAIRDKKSKEIQEKQQAAAALQNQLRTQGATLTPAKRSEMEKDLQRRGLELNQLQESARNEIQFEAEDAQKKFQSLTEALVQQFAEEGKYSVVFERGIAAYASPALDVTPALVDRINKATVKAPAKPEEGKP